MPIIDSIKKKNIKPILEVNCRPQPGQDEALSAKVRWHDGQIFMVVSLVGFCPATSRWRSDHYATQPPRIRNRITIESY